GAEAPKATTPGRVGVREARPGRRPKLLAEGTFLPSRRGRMVRAPEGEWMYVFDADARGLSEAPMVLMPCQNLAAMERITAQRGEGATFTVSGQVFAYKGKNYLLPALYIVNRASADLTPVQ
ncbi:MAG: hypothetical protein H7Y88_10985, partial [Phycisphaerales bacterium]|nr:hypothetical protein [Phycisphaerales bacterium]